MINPKVSEGGPGKGVSVAPLGVTEVINISTVCLSKCTVEPELCGRVDDMGMQKDSLSLAQPKMKTEGAS